MKKKRIIDFDNFNFEKIIQTDSEDEEYAKTKKDPRLLIDEASPENETFNFEDPFTVNLKNITKPKNIESLRKLLQIHGTSIQKQFYELDKSGFSVIHHIARNNSVDVAKILLEFNIDFTFSSRKDKLSPVHLSAQNFNFESAAVMTYASRTPKPNKKIASLFGVSDADSDRVGLNSAEKSMRATPEIRDISSVLELILLHAVRIDNKQIFYHVDVNGWNVLHHPTWLSRVSNF